MKKSIAAGLLASIFCCALTACGQSSPGVAIEWGRSAAVPQPSQGPVSLATASPRPSPDGAGLGAGMWNSLNSNTAEVARGEYVIISELERALELQISKMLPNR